MAFTFKHILNLCEKRGFLLNTNTNRFNLGPIGNILLENLKNEWLHSNVTNRDINVFLNTNGEFGTAYDFVKSISEDKLPFGVAQITTETKVSSNSINTELDEYINNGGAQIKLDSFMFVAPSTSIQYFHKWQRQRRMWWRKFSASPGRYALTDIQTSPGTEQQNVEITSVYPWGAQTIERISLCCNGLSTLSKQQLIAKDGRKRIDSHCVVSTTYLNKMVLNTLCDVYDEGNILRFHRKIAPFKISFAVTSSSSSTDQLNELALYLCRKLRANNISVLLLPNGGRTSLDAQWRQFDELGIPYCVVLNDGTLKNGIASMRNRDTTLKEQIHISDLLEYVEKIFKNY